MIFSNIKSSLLFGLASLLTCTACDSFLDKEPLNEYSVATLYQTEHDIRLALNGLYREIRGFNPDGYPQFSEYVYATFTDDAYDRRGAAQSSDLDFSSSKNKLAQDWESRYAIIRNINEFLARAPQAEGSFADPQLYKRYLAEARFMRALNYARLNFLFGAVPLLTEPTEPDFFPRRATREKVFDFVSDELAAIAKDLPEKYNNANDVGRITKGAALAIQARHLLNGIDWYPDKQSLYSKAAEAAGSVYKSRVYSLDAGEAGYQKLFTRASANGASNEAILTLFYNRDFKSHGYQVVILPKGAFSGSRSNNSNYIGATNALVESYQMKANGLAVSNPASGYDPAKPWEGRDPRLAATILKAGDMIPAKGGDGKSDLYVFDAHPKKNPTVTLENGKIIGSVTTDDVNKNEINRTGYGFKKYMDFDFITPVKTDIHYHFIRYAEVILLYAEAILGKDADINKAMALVNEVRARVGMPNVVTSYGAVNSKEKALEIILQERRSEFALEGPQRFFDIRRHHLGEQLFKDGNVYGIPLGDGRNANANVKDGDLDNAKKIIVGKRNFNAIQYYLWSIPLVAIQQNDNLTKDPE
ncbi:RagB/SusD family nutrient uptake outer membrane protein [Sphingobacterium humi]|uniref:RagB/SusD family nutrient uptake outer membrane protein n=1 Tax=Sphingobacterium humi TaxID=1796905 RepID=A0A6N8KZN3_9SPHI|nr:RagB/SusD family nutrient uptake outer membrane protein [Sphingobacterium humi]MVZ62963.1 RagB/SusD family nutrient uptake outer membrane protein [Sphingobacterium humi]